MTNPTRHLAEPPDGAQSVAHGLLTARIAAVRARLHACRDDELAARALDVRVSLGDESAHRAWCEEHLDELPAAERTAACRRYGWEDMIHRSAGTDAAMRGAESRRRLAAMTDNERAELRYVAEMSGALQPERHPNGS